MFWVCLLYTQEHVCDCFWTDLVRYGPIIGTIESHSGIDKANPPGSSIKGNPRYDYSQELIFLYMMMSQRERGFEQLGRD